MVRVLEKEGTVFALGNHSLAWAMIHHQTFQYQLTGSAIDQKAQDHMSNLLSPNDCLIACDSRLLRP